MPRMLVRTYIDSDILERFNKRFGDYGAVSFTLESAMSEMLDMTDGNPDQEELVRQAIRLHVEKSRPRPQRVNNVK